MIKLHIGLDDTDSPRGGCTTKVAALMIENFRRIDVSFLDYPNLIRLNPNVPWKTRGNGAVCLRLLCDKGDLDDLKEIAIQTVEENSDLHYPRTDPGIVFLTGDVPIEIETFAEMAITGLVRKREAFQLIRRYRAEAVCFNEGRGVIGALASIGEQLKKDYTYEFIAYRTPENVGKPRMIDSSSVLLMSKELGSMSFNNVDEETGRILITPHGPDPVLYGIRGESPDAVRRGHELVVSYEPIDRWVIFRTNQGTDAHLRRIGSIVSARPFCPAIIKGEVASKPRVIAGGHVIFQLKDQTGTIDCAAYEPTGDLKEKAKMLRVGDIVEVYGGIRKASTCNPLTINLEKINVLRLAPEVILCNPLCPRCGKRMKSMGRGQGFECKKCGLHGKRLEKIAEEAKRSLELGIYVTSPRSQRHLTKPLSRYNLEKCGPPEFLGKPIPIDSFYGVGTSSG
ncbi:MAG: tRNA(Ile)(2)-agmatinylcytidine synthase [Nitrososphaerota archaeon]|nr:tRNA(Ile)(2)-agmatinylcytidine synthase [Candidatus Bathyarchaeota archaeon]MDW8048402.1 tRNA(Ile)(2)-agmatinylcytidine synthase [Nitrososphaerota archaeon]